MKKSLCCLLILFVCTKYVSAQTNLWQQLPLQFNANPTVMYYDDIDDVSYITGTFSMVGEDSCNMVKWDGNALTLLPQAPIPYNITTIARYNGKIYAGGGLGLASWNGSTWTLLDDNAVFCLYPHEGKLYVGGGFSDIGGTGIGSLATWNDTACSDVYQLDTFINSEGSSG